VTDGAANVGMAFVKPEIDLGREGESA